MAEFVLSTPKNQSMHRLIFLIGLLISVAAAGQNKQPVSVTDMLKKMAGKKLIIYEKSRGFKLTEKGKQIAVSIIRKHRLWEVFLVEKFRLIFPPGHR